MEKRDDWLKPPLSKEDAPVPEGSLLAAVLQLGDSTDNLGRQVEANVNMRRGLVVLVILVAVLVGAQSIYGMVIYHRIATVETIAVGLTTPEQQRQQIARADYRMDRTIYCTNNFNQAMIDPDIELDPRCPTEFPSPPISVMP